MRRRGWWIAGGIVLLWLSPLVWGMVSSVIKKHQQQAYYERVAESNRRIAERLAPKFSPEEKQRLREGFDKAMAEARAESQRRFWELKESMKPKPFIVDEPKRGRYVETEMERIYMQNLINNMLTPKPRTRKPDLTGIYTTIPLTGPETGTVQINSVIGPR